jgi:hypothetical protein
MFKNHPAISEKRDFQVTTPLILTFFPPPRRQPYQNCPTLFPFSHLKPYQNGPIPLYQPIKAEIYAIS